MTAAWDWTNGSAWAYSAITAWRMGRNFGFSEKEDGVGGSFVVEPMARECVGGSVDRKERI